MSIQTFKQYEQFMFLSHDTDYRCNQEITKISSAWELSLGLVDPEFRNCE